MSEFSHQLPQWERNIGATASPEQLAGWSFLQRVEKRAMQRVYRTRYEKKRQAHPSPPRDPPCYRFEKLV